MPRKGWTASPETRERMRASHLCRWKKNRDRYLEANARGGNTRKGSKYKPPRNSYLYNQYGICYKSIKNACRELGLVERLIRLVLEGKRKSTGGYQFKLAGSRHDDYRRDRARKGLTNGRFDDRVYV